MLSTYELPWLSGSNKRYSPCSWIKNYLLHWETICQCLFCFCQTVPTVFTRMQTHQLRDWTSSFSRENSATPKTAMHYLINFTDTYSENAATPLRQSPIQLFVHLSQSISVSAIWCVCVCALPILLLHFLFFSFFFFLSLLLLLLFCSCQSERPLRLVPVNNFFINALPFLFGWANVEI